MWKSSTNGRVELQMRLRKEMNHIIKLEKYKSQTDSGLQYQKMIPIKSTQRKQDQENTTKMKDEMLYQK